MKINFGMWKKALSVLVKMDGKAEWDALDVDLQVADRHPFGGHHGHNLCLRHRRFAGHAATGSFPSCPGW